MLTCIVLLASLLPASASLAATSVAYSKLKVAGTWVNVVTADLNAEGVRVTPAIARWGIGTCESFRSILRRTRPAAAINGTFFDTRTLCPTGDIVIDGQLLHRGGVGTALAIDYNNRLTFLPSRRSDLYTWSDYDHVLVAGPALIMRGRTVVQPRDEGFKSRVHYSKRQRAAVGLTSGNKLLFVTTRSGVYLSRLAKVMRGLKCVDAAVLDGGSSTGLYWKGKLLVNPRRGMTNCLLVYDDISSYERHRNCFYPVSRYTSASGGGS